MTDIRDREVARRVFAAELADATHTYRTEDDTRAPIYALLPTGERANRVLISGTLLTTSEYNTDADADADADTDADSTGDESIWGMELKDPTAEIAAYATPDSDASHTVSQLATPENIALTGKPRIHEQADGTRSVSLQAETVGVISPTTYDHWVADTADQTLTRIDSFDVGYPPAQRTTDEYSTQPTDYKDPVETALKQIE